MRVPSTMIALFLLALTLSADATCNPHIVYAPREVSVKRGDEFELLCVVQSDDDSDTCGVTWLQFDPSDLTPKPVQGLHIATSEAVRIPGLVRITTWFLGKYNAQVSTMYRCKVQNGAFADIEVTVVDPDVESHVTAVRPFVEDLPEVLQVREGGSIAIVCIVRYEDPSYERSFQWLKLNDSEHEARPVAATGGDFGQYESYNYESQLYTHVLVVKNAREEDAGQYRCQLIDHIYKDTNLVVMGG